MERHEAMMRRTLERSQQLEQRQKRWSWGGVGSPGAGSRDGESENTPSTPVGLSVSINSPTQPVAVDAVDCISVSSSPHKTNSKSTLSPSGDRLNVADLSSSPGETTENLASDLQQTEKEKKEKRQLSPGPVSSVTSTLRRSQSPASMSKRSSSPAMKASSKIRTRSPSSGKEFPTSPTSSGKPSPMRRRPSSNNIAGSTGSKKKSKEKGDLARQKSEEAAGGDIKSPEVAERDTPVTTPVKEHERKKTVLGEGD
ncbi:hypothetical protein scyTo_0004880 [Scyliorhinus torazame]|uniref:Uncharacterized protein n=1 Tax=Scyliorhinus torazame TaxID=75743 RepID=A0A401NYG3_SCYTO|nr:hypothetical protein [Scyliorhinus torazame]